jgi:HEAT repeat protein
MSLLRPLLMDMVPSIQQSAALALGRLAQYNQDLAAEVVNASILRHLVEDLGEKNRFFKKNAAFVLKSVAKHNPDLANFVVQSGALKSLVICLEEFDPEVKESAAYALAYIAK